jgi:hypothetical protein
VKVVINGAGIAGPTLAYWLQRAGHQVLLVEQAPQLRRGGYIIDFWGLGYDIAEKMGLIPRIRSQGYQVREVRFVDKRGRRRGGFSTDAFQRLTGGRFTSLRRSDLAAAIYDAAAEHIETLFGDSVAGITDKGSGVEVSFVHAAPREADLVIGAGGLHSPVRQLAFGPDSDFEFPLGYYVAAFEIDGYQPRDELIFLTHGIPGRQISRFSMRDDKTLFLFVFESKYYPSEFPTTDEGRKAAVSTAFEGVGWECPQILAAMQDVGSIYFDRVSQILDEGPGRADRRRRRGGLPAGRRGDRSGDDRSIHAGGRAARPGWGLRRGLCALPGAHAAVRAGQAGIRLQVRFKLRPQQHPGRGRPEPGHRPAAIPRLIRPADRPQPARRSRAAGLRLLGSAAAPSVTKAQEPWVIACAFTGPACYTVKIITSARFGRGGCLAAGGPGRHQGDTPLVIESAHFGTAAGVPEAPRIP